MEAVPRMPMLAFQLKNCPELISSMFTGFIKQQIAKHYHEDGNAYSKECTELEQLRESALRVSRDFMGCSTLKKYYSQIVFVCSRMKMTDEPESGLVFTWDDAHSGKTIESSDVRLEQASVLYNIGALHSILGAMDNRQNPEGMKVSCTHFQCAAWAFQQIRDYYGLIGAISSDMNHDLLTFQINLMLAQAQECILEKSMTDNRKSTITAKVAAQIRDYYTLSLKHLEACDPSNLVGSKRYKEWKKRIELKRNFHQCIVYYYQGCQVEDQQKWGERVAFFQASVDKLNESIKLAKGEESEITEALRFTMDVVGGKFNASKKDNDFVYHDKIPALDDLPEVKGAQLVKGIPFNPTDPEVSGPDIFKRLVPMKAHEAASLYSEEKAKLLRTVGGHIEDKDDELQQYQDSLQLDPAKIYPEHEHLPQILLEKCAAISVKPDAIKDLVASMQSLSNISTDVEANITEILDMLEEDERNANELQTILGKKSPDVTIAEIRKECLKYKEGLSKAAQSNTELHKAMNTHISNLKLLSSLEDLEKALPAMDDQTPEDEAIIQEMTRLMDKVEEMKSQRKQLEEQFRSQVHDDDITNVLITREEGNLEEFFGDQLKKHDQLVGLIEQNLSAQSNILHALTATNAKYANIRRQIQETRLRRGDMVDNLIQSYDVYEDLLAKCQKGVEFYRKLELNVQRLLERTHRVCRAHEEERQQVLARLKPKAPPPARPSAPKPGEVAAPTASVPPGVPVADGFSAAARNASPGGIPGMPPIDNVDLGALPDMGGAPDAPRLTLKDYLPFMKPATFGNKKRGKESSAMPPVDPTAAAMGAAGIEPSMMAMYAGITGGVGQVPQLSMQGGSLPNSHTVSPVHMPKQPASQPGSPAHLPQNNMRPNNAGAGYPPGHAVSTATGLPPDSLAGASAASTGATPYGAPTGPTAYSAPPHRQAPTTLPTTAAAGMQPFPPDHILSPSSAPGAPSTRRPYIPNQIPQNPAAGHMASAGHPSVPGPGGLQRGGSQVPGSIGVPPGGPSSGIQHYPQQPPQSVQGPQQQYHQPTQQQQQHPQQQQVQQPQQPQQYQQPTQQQQQQQQVHGIRPGSAGQATSQSQSNVYGYAPAPDPSTAQGGPSSHRNFAPSSQTSPLPPGSASQGAPTGASANPYQVGPGYPSQNYGNAPTNTASASSAGYAVQAAGSQPQAAAFAAVAPSAATAVTASGPSGVGAATIPQTTVGKDHMNIGVPGSSYMNAGSDSQAGQSAVNQTWNSQSNQGYNQAGYAGFHAAGQAFPGAQQYPRQLAPGQVPPAQGQNLGAPGQGVPGMTAHRPGGPGQATPAPVSTQQVLHRQVAPGQIMSRQVIPGSANQGPGVPGFGISGQTVPGQSSIGHPLPRQNTPGQTATGQALPTTNQPSPGQFQAANNTPTQPSTSQYTTQNTSMPKSSQPWSQAHGLYTQAQVNQYNTHAQGITSTAPVSMAAAQGPHPPQGQYVSGHHHSNQAAMGQYPAVSQSKVPSQMSTGAQPSTAVPPGSQMYNQNMGYPQSQTGGQGNVCGVPYPQTGSVSTPQQAQNTAVGGATQNTQVGASSHQPYTQPGGYSPASQGHAAAANQRFQQPYSGQNSASANTFAYQQQQQHGQQPRNTQQQFQKPPSASQGQNNAQGMTSAQQPTFQGGFSQSVAGHFSQQPTQQSQGYYQQQYQQPQQQQQPQPQAFTPQMSTLPSPLQPSPAPAVGSGNARGITAASPNPPQDMTPKQSPLLQPRTPHPAQFPERASSLPPQANSTIQQPAASSTPDRPNLYQATSSSLDDILSSSPENSKDGTHHPNKDVLTPKVITEEDLRQQREEKMKNSLKQTVTRDPYVDQQLLNRFVSDVEKFEKLVEGLSKETLSGPTPLDKEWKELAEDQEKEARKHSMAIARCYPMKNRFSDVMPYDSTRVILTGGSDDYINANYLGDLATVCPKFIVTQAPLPATMVDFWQMVYEKGTEVIVCLNQENEAGKKNHLYWPKNKGQTIVHGPYSLYLQSYRDKQEWVERIITLTHIESRQSRSVVHLQFLQWSPGGVPSTPAQLLQFVCEVHMFYIQQRNLVKPVVVHCSNGVDRTGAFCIIYTGIQEINQGHGLVNIPDLVRQLRQNRKYMVGEKELLRFCYHAVLYYGQDLLMKRGILTSRASFSDKLPAPGEKGHQRKPSEDFILGTNMNLNTIQSSVAKMTIRSVSPASSDVATGDGASGAAPAETLSNGDKMASQDGMSSQNFTVPTEGQGSSHPGLQTGPADAARQHVFDPIRTQDRSRSGSTSSVQSHASNQSQGQISGSASPSKHPDQNAMSNLPPSLADLQDPNMFKLEVTPPSKRKITKASFGDQTNHISGVVTDPNDPLSSLDPLWSLKNKDQS